MTFKRLNNLAIIDVDYEEKVDIVEIANQFINEVKVHKNIFMIINA